MLDKNILYHCGSSFKDLGVKCFAINESTIFNATPIAQKVNETLEPIREKRAKYENNDKLIKEIIYEGSKKARTKAKEVLDGVIDVVKMYK